MNRFVVGYWECGSLHVCYVTDDEQQAYAWAKDGLMVYERKE